MKSESDSSDKTPSHDLAIYSFDHDHGVQPRNLAHLLGGKGAGLAEMTQVLNLPVPPGFTIAVPICRYYRKFGWPVGLDDQIEFHIAELGRKMGRRFGDEGDPLLLAVRSGAARSMPGMLDTVLNLGLNDRTVAGLENCSGDHEFAWDSYRRFLQMYAVTVMGIPESIVEISPGPLRSENLSKQVEWLKEQILRSAGTPVPDDPIQQLRMAIEAVFRSWDSARAKTYRAAEGIDDDLGTAVNVQAMVFGNRGKDSGTGVLFTRNPSNGKNELVGDYLPCGQGEDVVSGKTITMPIAELANHSPAVYGELKALTRKLEVHYRDMCDIEFTVERGHIWLLQTRIAKRNSVAAVRIAVELADDPEIQLGHDEAIKRADDTIRSRARSTILAQLAKVENEDSLLATGIGAAPGWASGRIVLSSEAAVEADDDVILVRRDTSPEDIAGMAAAMGILTSSGGIASHAAVVAREWGVPTVVGAVELTVSPEGITTSKGVFIAEGETITIDGSSGAVWRGAVAPLVMSDDLTEAAIERKLPELLTLESWAVTEQNSVPPKVGRAAETAGKP